MYQNDTQTHCYCAVTTENDRHNKHEVTTAHTQVKLKWHIQCTHCMSCPWLSNCLPNQCIHVTSIKSTIITGTMLLKEMVLASKTIDTTALYSPPTLYIEDVSIGNYCISDNNAASLPTVCQLIVTKVKLCEATTCVFHTMMSLPWQHVSQRDNMHHSFCIHVILFCVIHVLWYENTCHTMKTCHTMTTSVTLWQCIIRWGTHVIQWHASCYYNPCYTITTSMTCHQVLQQASTTFPTRTSDLPHYPF